MKSTFLMFPVLALGLFIYSLSMSDLRSGASTVVAEEVKVGKPAPDFEQNTVDGESFKLSSLRGKYVLIDFWASWCGPCRRENPDNVKMYDRFKGSNFEIVGVSLDRDKNSWVRAIEADNLEWIQVSDLGFWDNAVSRQYGVRSIPHTVLIDKKGIVLAVGLRGKALEKEIAKHIN
ncbi:MAG: TlpA family protein disulfide reductase [Bernardetiaceae bacterium]|nr:TlpA family protein disulfide reductase [Bernardetiaceae bacterium]